MRKSLASMVRVMQGQVSIDEYLLSKTKNAEGNDKEYPIVYDRYGRMNYNPEFHTEHGKKFTEEDLEYLCKFYEIDGPEMMSFALGKTEKVIANKIHDLREKGLYEYYKNLNLHWSA